MKPSRQRALKRCLKVAGLSMHPARFNYLWRLGSRALDSKGYAFRDIYSGGVRYGRIMEHRAVMEELLDRELTSREQVHHINEVRTDNRPENLALCSNLAAHRWCHTEEAKVFLG